MFLYHFTSKYHLVDILKEGYLRLTPSNLEIPVNLHRDEETMTMVADNDDVRPVVWLTSSIRISSPEVLGNNKYTEQELDEAIRQGYIKESDKKKFLDSKDSVRIEVKKTSDMFRWTRWAQENGIDPEWFKKLKKRAKDNGNWYVVERKIPVSDFISITVDGKNITNYDEWMKEYESQQ